MTPSVAIIIVNWNGLKLTDACLESLKNINYPYYKIVLVDNASTDGSSSYFKAHYNDVKLITLSKNTGFTGGNNTGMQWALEQGFDYIMLLNNDTVVNDTSFLTKMVEVMKQNENIAIACPTIFYYNSGKIWYAGGKLSLWSGWKHYHAIPDSSKKKYKTGYVTGCCLLAKSDMIREIGFLNNAYFLSVEDVEWSLRAKNNGWELAYIPDSILLHKDSMSSKSAEKGKYSPTRIYFEWRNSIWFIREYGNPFQKGIVWPLYFGGIILFKMAAYMLLGRSKKLKAIAKAVKDGLTADARQFKNGGI